MRKKILLSISFLLSFAPLSAAQEAPRSLQQKFAQAQEGDFIVTAQEGNYSLLFIRSLTADTILLEEVSVPEKQIEAKKFDWKKWVKEKAPGHTSWILYEIDLKSGALIECFSYSKNSWLYLDSSEQFLTKLLTLPLYPVSEKERKKIGPQPTDGEMDRRSPWNPPLLIEGKKVDKPSYDVVKTKWPEDGTRLSQCAIELYFSKLQPTFPFPYWLEVQSPHYAFKMRTVDSGHGLVSPMLGSMPHRAPQIMSPTQKEIENWKLSIQTPVYFQKLHLFALDVTGENKAMIPVAFTVRSGKHHEEIILEIACSELNRILKASHRYQWVVIPDDTRNIYVESDETFVWK